MKAKSFMLLLATLFILPVSEAAITKKRRIIHYKESVRRERITTRVPIDYTIETTGDENGLQIIFLFPMHESDITVTDKNGNVVIEENQTNLYEGKALYVHSSKAYPYTLVLTSPAVDITGEITLEEEN